LSGKAKLFEDFGKSFSQKVNKHCVELVAF
jgi:hypothetical protein